VPHNINLIDTPGHADFTFEVVRSLRILDGAVCILDGVAGVEAQTEKVWSQAADYRIPKIIFVNKLDREGASFGKTVQDIALRLHTWPAVCQIPWWEGGKGRFMGVGDPVNLQAYRWAESGDGKTVSVINLDGLINIDVAFHNEIKKARAALVELLSEHDDVLVEKYLECEGDHQAILATDITASLRRCVLNKSCNVVPVLAGASFRNIGVQPLLDGIVQLLPSPDESPDPEISLGKLGGRLGDLLDGRLTVIEPDGPRNTHKKNKGLAHQHSKAVAKNLEGCALAFKVVHDPRRGVLVYIRVYSGSIQRNATLFNTNLQVSEKAQRLLKMYASEAVEISEISTGQIGVIHGLKFARTGDTLISYAGVNPKAGPPVPFNSLQLRPIDIPPAVFFSSVECDSLSEEKAVSHALALLIREDPSLQLSVDEESGQTLLSGMGEFHLEIAGDRLINDFKTKAMMGNIEVAYRESILGASGPETCIFDKETAGKRGKAGCIATVSLLSATSGPVEPEDEYTGSTTQDGNRITTIINNDSSSDSDLSTFALPPHLPLSTLHTSLHNGALAALARGVTHSFPCHGIDVSLTLDLTSHIFGPETTPAALASAARLATKAALQTSTERTGSALLELVMNVTISVDDANLGAVSNDISSTRGGHIISLDDKTTAGGSRNDLPPLIDLRRVYIPPDPYATTSHDAEGEANDDQARSGSRHQQQRNILARVPLKEMVGYLKHLRKLTGGRGTFVMSADRFERVVGQREKALLKGLKGF
jgi:elongation factor G